MKYASLALASALLLWTGCSSDDSSTSGSGGSGGSGGASGQTTSSSSADGGGTSTSNTGGSGSTSNATGSTSNTTTSVTSTGNSTAETTSTADSTATVSSGSTGGGTDLYAEERAACIARINELRATVGAPAYAQWGDGEVCADTQATSDEQTNSPHGSFGDCGEWGQNECLGHGPEGIVQCLNQMWAERDQAGCAGCDACALGDQAACDNCDFYGQETGDVCGHYVNMRSLDFGEAACGFSSLGGWDVINFR